LILLISRFKSFIISFLNPTVPQKYLKVYVDFDPHESEGFFMVENRNLCAIKKKPYW